MTCYRRMDGLSIERMIVMKVKTQAIYSFICGFYKDFSKVVVVVVIVVAIYTN